MSNDASRGSIRILLLCLCSLGGAWAETAGVNGEQAAQPAASTKYVVVDQDASGPAGSDMTALLVFLQSPRVTTLGITVVTGDAWRDEEVAHTLRLLELVGRTDVKVYPGAEYPLMRTQEETRISEQIYGKATWKGAWSEGGHAANFIPVMPEGAPVTKPAAEDAAHFLIRSVHQHPHQVTVFALGPLTDIALAIRLDAHFAELAKELVLMGGSIDPHTEDPEFVNNPRHEFNYWFDPEAASITLRAAWEKITVTTVDVSIRAKLTEKMVESWSHFKTPAAQYLARYTTRPFASYMWDELAAVAWLEPDIITQKRSLYMDVNTVESAAYGDTMTWDDKDRPSRGLHKVEAQTDVNAPELEKRLHELLSRPAPGESNPLMGITR